MFFVDNSLSHSSGSFPRCSWLGHVSSKGGAKERCDSTCGTEVTILFDIDFETIGGDKSDLLVMGEIVKEGDSSSFHEHTLLSQADITARVDRRESTQRTIYQAKLMEIPHDCSDFSGGKKIRANIFPPKGGFKYAWKSNRWICESKHTFEWTVLQKVHNEDSYRILMIYRPCSSVSGTHFCVLSTRGRKSHEKSESRHLLFKAATTSECGIYERPNNFYIQSRKVIDEDVQTETNIHYDPIKKNVLSSTLNCNAPSQFGLYGPDTVLENEYFDSFLVKNHYSPCFQNKSFALSNYQMQNETSQIFQNSRKHFDDAHLGAHIDFGLRDEDVEEVFRIIRKNFAQVS